MPFFEQVFPDVKDCHPATINLKLETPLRIRNPDFTTTPIQWESKGSEVFSFLRIRFECPLGTEPRRAWIYIPHNSPHRHKVFQVEVLTEKIDGLVNGTPCLIHIDEAYEEIPMIIV